MRLHLFEQTQKLPAPLGRVWASPLPGAFVRRRETAGVRGLRAYRRPLRERAPDGWTDR